MVKGTIKSRLKREEEKYPNHIFAINHGTID